MKPARTLRYGLEYAALRCGLAFIENFPLSIAVRAAGLAGGAYFLLNGRRRRLAEDNIRRAGIAAGDDEVRRIARESFANMGIVAVESLKFARLVNAENWRDHVEVEGDAPALEALRDVRHGIIIASAHLGNWEIAAQIVGFFRPIAGVARRMNNPYVDKLIKQRSSRRKFMTIEKGGGGHALLSALKRGEALALLMDQHARTAGMKIDFFGRPAATHTSPARLHLATGAPLFFGYCLRTGPLTYKTTVKGPLNFAGGGDKQGDVRAIMEWLNRELETAIRRAPEQYLWAHRRWRD